MELSNLSIVLASKSPRRREILSALGVPFTVVVADADESSRTTDPAALVEELALRKGCAVRELLREEGRFESTLVIAADTVVSIDGEILGKPKDVADAERMLRLLSGRAHQVSSGIALLFRGDDVDGFLIFKILCGFSCNFSLGYFIRKEDDPHIKP